MKTNRTPVAFLPILAPTIQCIFALLAAVAVAVGIIRLIPSEPDWIKVTIYVVVSAVFFITTIFCNLVIMKDSARMDTELSWIGSGDLNTPVFVQKVAVVKNQHIVALSLILYSDEKRVIYGPPELRLMQNRIDFPCRGQYILRENDGGIVFEPYISPSAK